MVNSTDMSTPSANWTLKVHPASPLIAYSDGWKLTASGNHTSRSGTSSHNSYVASCGSSNCTATLSFDGSQPVQAVGFCIDKNQAKKLQFQIDGEKVEPTEIDDPHCSGDFYSRSCTHILNATVSAQDSLHLFHFSVTPPATSPQIGQREVEGRSSSRSASPNICHPSINGSTTFRFTGTRIAVYGTSFPQQKSTNFRIYEDQPEGNLNSTFTNGYNANISDSSSGIDGQVLFYTSSLPTVDHNVTIVPSSGPPAPVSVVVNCDDGPPIQTVTQAAVSATTATATSTITSTSLLPPKSPSSTSKASNAEHKALIIIPIALTLGLLLALGYILYLRRRAKRRQLDVETPAPGEPDPDAGMDDDWQAMYTPAAVHTVPSGGDTVQSRFYEPLDWMGSTRSSGTTATVSNVYGFPKTRDSDISGSGFDHSEFSTSSIRDDDASSITQTAYAI